MVERDPDSVHPDEDLDDEDWAVFEWAAFDAFDTCLMDAGIDDLDPEGPAVFVMTGDGEEAIQFGETPGTVTITGDVNGVTVATDGVTVIDEQAIDAAYEQCEELLDEDAEDTD